MLTPTRALILAAGVALAGCGGGSSSSTPTSPTVSAPVTPITVTLRLSVAAPSSVADVTNLPPRIATRTALTVVVLADGGTVNIAGTCTFRGDFAPVGGSSSFNFTPPGAIAPGSPFSTTLPLDGFLPFPIPSNPGALDCRVTGTDQRGGSVSASQSIDIGPSALLPVPSTCTPGPNTICALNDRFKVDVNWRNPAGQSGNGQVLANGRYPDGGYFFFSDANNWELLVQVLNRCDQTPNRFWVFMAGQTNVEVNVTVTDTRSGVFHSYQNPLGSPFQAVQDTNAFATCP